VSERDRFRISTDHDCATVWVEGDVDASEAQELEHILLDLIEAGARQLAVDVARVSFMGSAGLTAFVVANKRLSTKNGGAISLRAPSKSIRRIFEITGLDSVFPVIE
jgi:anti-sigma B factor antagonist